MIQLIVYTGFYWAVKVMESLLVVNSATACALPSTWISTLRGLGVGAKRQGRAQTADTHNLWLWWVSCLLKNQTVPWRGNGAHLWHAAVNKASGKVRREGWVCLGAHSNSFSKTLRVGWGGAWRWRRATGRRTHIGGGWTVNDGSLRWAT